MIRFDGLCAGYDGTQRLHDISCSVPEGKLVAVIGPNGCGKSTLMKCAAGILKPFCGRILLGDTPLSEFSPRGLARKISYMPQSRLIPGMPVRQLAAHGRYPHLKWGRSMTDADREIVRSAMVRTGVESHADRSVARLSGGERQRAYLAMMLAQQTPLMLLDEPAAYLDLSGQFQLMELLRELRDEGHTVVLVLHDLALALEYADTLLLMQSGRLLQTGTPGEIYASGRLQDVFDVEVERTPKGKYVFSRRAC